MNSVRYDQARLHVKPTRDQDAVIKIYRSESPLSDDPLALLSQQPVIEIDERLSRVKLAEKQQIYTIESDVIVLENMVKYVIRDIDISDNLFIDFMFHYKYPNLVFSDRHYLKLNCETDRIERYDAEQDVFVSSPNDGRISAVTIADGWEVSVCRSLLDGAPVRTEITHHYMGYNVKDGFQDLRGITYHGPQPRLLNRPSVTTAIKTESISNQTTSPYMELTLHQPLYEEQLLKVYDGRGEDVYVEVTPEVTTSLEAIATATLSYPTALHLKQSDELSLYYCPVIGADEVLVYHQLSQATIKSNLDQTTRITCEVPHLHTTLAYDVDSLHLFYETPTRLVLTPLEASLTAHETWLTLHTRDNITLDAILTLPDEDLPLEETYRLDYQFESKANGVSLTDYDIKLKVGDFHDLDAIVSTEDPSPSQPDERIEQIIMLDSPLLTVQQSESKPLSAEVINQLKSDIDFQLSFKMETLEVQVGEATPLAAFGTCTGDLNENVIDLSLSHDHVWLEAHTSRHVDAYVDHVEGREPLPTLTLSPCRLWLSEGESEPLHVSAHETLETAEMYLDPNALILEEGRAHQLALAQANGESETGVVVTVEPTRITLNEGEFKALKSDVFYVEEGVHVIVKPTAVTVQAGLTHQLTSEVYIGEEPVGVQVELDVRTLTLAVGASSLLTATVSGDSLTGGEYHVAVEPDAITVDEGETHQLAAIVEYVEDHQGVFVTLSNTSLTLDVNSSYRLKANVTVVDENQPQEPIHSPVYHAITTGTFDSVLHHYKALAFYPDGTFSQASIEQSAELFCHPSYLNSFLEVQYEGEWHRVKALEPNQTLTLGHPYLETDGFDELIGEYDLRLLENDYRVDFSELSYNRVQFSIPNVFNHLHAANTRSGHTMRVCTEYGHLERAYSDIVTSVDLTVPIERVAIYKETVVDGISSPVSFECELIKNEGIYYRASEHYALPKDVDVVRDKTAVCTTDNPAEWLTFQNSVSRGVDVRYHVYYHDAIGGEHRYDYHVTIT